jgi:hypothetical protein
LVLEICKLKLQDCEVCGELYPLADKSVHDNSDCHVIAKLKKELAEAKAAKQVHVLDDPVLPAAKRQKKESIAIPIHDKEDEEEKSSSSS